MKVDESIAAKHVNESIFKAWRTGVRNPPPPPILFLRVCKYMKILTGLFKNSLLDKKNIRLDLEELEEKIKELLETEFDVDGIYYFGFNIDDKFFFISTYLFDYDVIDNDNFNDINTSLLMTAFLSDLSTKVEKANEKIFPQIVNILSLLPGDNKKYKAVFSLNDEGFTVASLLIKTKKEYGVVINFHITT